MCSKCLGEQEGLGSYSGVIQSIIPGYVVHGGLRGMKNLDPKLWLSQLSISRFKMPQDFYEIRNSIEHVGKVREQEEESSQSECKGNMRMGDQVKLFLEYVRAGKWASQFHFCRQCHSLVATVRSALETS